jgi:branched-chain amino acid transport system ATP-binding protein
MLRLADVHTYYGDSHVLQGVTLHVERGSVAAVLGRNGVGKTTLCRSIVGFTPARSGQVLFGGIDITRMPAHRIHGLRLGLVPQGRRVFPSLTVDEHLAIASSVPSPRWDIRRVFDVFPRLEERRRAADAGDRARARGESGVRGDGRTNRGTVRRIDCRGNRRHSPPAR